MIANGALIWANPYEQDWQWSLFGSHYMQSRAAMIPRVCFGVVTVLVVRRGSRETEDCVLHLCNTLNKSHPSYGIGNLL